MSFKIFLIWSSGGPFVQLSGTICAILVKSIMSNNSVSFFEFGPATQEEMSLKDISYLELWQPLPFVRWRSTICAILVECIIRNNSVK